MPHYFVEQLLELESSDNLKKRSPTNGYENGGFEDSWESSQYLYLFLFSLQMEFCALNFLNNSFMSSRFLNQLKCIIKQRGMQHFLILKRFCPQNSSSINDLYRSLCDNVTYKQERK